MTTTTTTHPDDTISEVTVGHFHDADRAAWTPGFHTLKIHLTPNTYYHLTSRRGDSSEIVIFHPTADDLLRIRDEADAGYQALLAEAEQAEVAA